MGLEGGGPASRAKKTEGREPQELTSYTRIQGDPIHGKTNHHHGQGTILRLQDLESKEFEPMKAEAGTWGEQLRAHEPAI